MLCYVCGYFPIIFTYNVTLVSLGRHNKTVQRQERKPTVSVCERLLKRNKDICSAALCRSLFVATGTCFKLSLSQSDDTCWTEIKTCSGTFGCDLFFAKLFVPSQSNLSQFHHKVTFYTISRNRLQNNLSERDHQMGFFFF